MSQYATIAEFAQHGIRDAALPASVTTDLKTAAIVAASGRADSYLGARFKLPLSAWGVDLTQAVSAIAAFELVSSQVGFNPEAGHNLVLITRKEDAVRWLEQVSRGQVTPTDITDSSTGGSTPGGAAPSARAYSLPPRGWTRGPRD